MTSKAEIRKALVILSPDLIRPDSPEQSPLLQRAVDLAKASGCELELFHVCHNPDLEHQLFESDALLERQRRMLADQDATVLAEIATRLKGEAIKVSHEVRWDAPRTDAMLRKIAESAPDIVMKQSRDHSFVLGISSNTDWDLVRRSPAHVWLVSDKTSSIRRVVTAIGNRLGDSSDITTAEDYDLLENATMISAVLKAEIYPVNAYQVPTPKDFGSGIPGVVVPVDSAAGEQHALRSQLVKKHSDSMQALAKFFRIDQDNVHVREGHPNKVIPEFANSIEADLIIMGARNISRIERLVSSVTVEPVLADTHCDILIVRDPDPRQLPDVAQRPILGVANFDLEQALIHPAETFDSPQQLASIAEISVELRNRILQAWEYDIRAGMAEENEGGPVREINVGALDDISSAKALIDTKQQDPADSQSSLH